MSHRPAWTILAVLGALLPIGTSAPADPGIYVARTELSDNGDDDGFADSNETVSIRVTLHNATEGIAIVAPILDQRARISRLAGLGLLAGGPTIIGCWIGAFTYSQVWALLFLGMGAGAIVQVIGAIVGRRPLSETFSPLNVLGLVTGYLVMYGTGFLVGAA